MSDELLDTKDELQDRVAARQMLSNPSKPPNFVMVFVDPPKRDASGNVVAPAKRAMRGLHS